MKRTIGAIRGALSWWSVALLGLSALAGRGPSKPPVDTPAAGAPQEPKDVLQAGCSAYRDSLWHLETAEALAGGKTEDTVMTANGIATERAPVRPLFVRERAALADKWAAAAKASSAADTPWGTSSADLGDRFSALASAARTIADGLERSDEKAATRGRTAMVETLNGLAPLRDAAAKRCYAPDGDAKTGRPSPPEIQKVMRAHFPQLRKCYETGLGRDAQLRGKVTFRFAIARDGSMPWVVVDDSDMPDKDAIDCMSSEIGNSVFPAPVHGVVTVVYPIQFAPDSPEPKPAAQ